MPRDDKRKSAPMGATIIIAIVIFVICALASAFLSVYHRDTIDALLAHWRSIHNDGHDARVAPPKISKTKRIERTFIPNPKLLLLRKVVSPDANFSMADAFVATDFCDLLRPELPQLKLAWQTNRFFSDASECAGELTAATSPNDQIHNSLFVQTQRNIFGASKVLRLKLVYMPNLQETDYRREFERAAGRALAHLFQDEAADMLAGIRSLTPFNVQIRDINVKLFEEQLLPGAFNLMIEARCGRYQCPTTNAYYRLSLPFQEMPAQVQQE